MFINELHLKNIGPYRGSNKIVLKTNSTSNKNTVLIYGENGSGKTSFLKAVKLGLFGSSAYGYRTNNNDYLLEVELLLNDHAKRENENDFHIFIDVDMVVNYTKENYQIKRSWFYENNKIKENIEIFKNELQLSNLEKDIFQTKLKDSSPPQLLDLCLFDGEEISKIINDNKLDHYIKSLSTVVFNLDLFNKLELHLKDYRNQTFDSSSLSVQQKELIKLEQEQESIKNHLVNLKNMNNRLHDQLEKNKVEYEQLKNDFSAYGGLVKQERDQLYNELNDLELKRRTNYENIKEFVANTLPFYLVKKLIKDTKAQLEQEENYYLYTSLEKKLTNDHLATLVNTNIIKDISTIDEFKKQLLNLIIDDINIELIHHTSFAEANKITYIDNKLKNNIKDEFLTMLSSNNKYLNKIKKIKKKIEINDNTSEFSVMIHRMEQLSKNIIECNQKRENITNEINVYQLQMDKVNNSIEKYEKNIRQMVKTKNSFDYVQQIISLSQHFREAQTKKRLQDVQIETAKILKSLLRKEDYVTSIKIDPETFMFYLRDNNKEIIDVKKLSSGEKHLVLLSIILAIFKVSKIRIPFFFDTLLGRLDQTHKKSVLTKYIPFCGDQVIILSTDSEIDDEYFDFIKPFVSNCYKLNFDVNTKQTSIEQLILNKQSEALLQ